jgi:hypothetical protein
VGVGLDAWSTVPERGEHQIELQAPDAESAIIRVIVEGSPSDPGMEKGGPG